MEDTIKSGNVIKAPVETQNQVLPPEPPIVTADSVVNQNKIDLAFQPETLTEAVTDQQKEDLVNKQAQERFEAEKTNPLDSILEQQTIVEEAKVKRTDMQSQQRMIGERALKAQKEYDDIVNAIDPRLGIQGIETRDAAQRRLDRQSRSFNLQNTLLTSRIAAEKAIEAENDPTKKLEEAKKLDDIQGTQDIIERYGLQGKEISIAAAELVYEKEQRYIAGDVAKGEELKAYNSMLSSGLIKEGEELEGAIGITNGSIGDAYNMLSATGVSPQKIKEQLKQAYEQRGATTEEAKELVDNTTLNQAIQSISNRIAAGEDVPDAEFIPVSSRLQAKGLLGDTKARDAFLGMGYLRSNQGATTAEIEQFIRAETEDPEYKFSSVGGRYMRTDKFGGYKIIIDKPKPVSIAPWVRQLKTNPHMFNYLTASEKAKAMKGGFVPGAETIDAGLLARATQSPEVFDSLSQKEKDNLLKAGYIPVKEGDNVLLKNVRQNPGIFEKLSQKKRDDLLSAGYIPQLDIAFLKRVQANPTIYEDLSQGQKDTLLRNGYAPVREGNKVLLKSLGDNPEIFEKLSKTTQDEVLKAGYVPRISQSFIAKVKANPSVFEGLSQSKKDQLLLNGYIPVKSADGKLLLQNVEKNPQIFEELSQGERDKLLNAGYIPPKEKMPEFNKKFLERVESNPQIFKALSQKERDDLLKNGFIPVKEEVINTMSKGDKNFIAEMQNQPELYWELSPSEQVNLLRLGYTPINEQKLMTNLGTAPEMYEGLSSAERAIALRNGFKPKTEESDALKTVLSDSAAELTDMQKLQGRELSTKLFGKRAGDKADNLTPIFNMMAKGSTVDDIEDTIRAGRQSGVYQGVYKTAATRVALNLPLAQGEQLANEVDRLLEDGKVGSAKITLSTGVRASLNATARKQFDGRREAIAGLSDVKEMFNEYSAAGGKKNLLVGTAENIRNKVFKDTGNAQLAEIGANIQTIIQAYRSSITGAAFSDDERKEYERQFPSTSETYELSDAKINGLINSFSRNRKQTFLSVIGEDAYSEIYNGVDPGLKTATGVKTTQQAHTPISNEFIIRQAKQDLEKSGQSVNEGEVFVVDKSTLQSGFLLESELMNNLDKYIKVQ